MKRWDMKLTFNLTHFDHLIIWKQKKKLLSPSSVLSKINIYICCLSNFTFKVIDTVGLLFVTDFIAWCPAGTFNLSLYIGIDKYLQFLLSIFFSVYFLYSLLKVESFILDQEDLDNPIMKTASELLLSSATDGVDLRTVDPETQARLEALLEAAGTTPTPGIFPYLIQE